MPNGVLWHDFDWQLLMPEPLSPLEQMALDKVLLDQVAKGLRPPTLRIWQWTRPTIVLGIFQSVKNETDAVACQQHGIEVVRRVSGGGAMFCEPGNTITYSIYAPDSLVAGMDFRASYAFFDGWVVATLKRLGVPCFYRPVNDIATERGKIAGAAQARHANAVLHHTSMAYAMNNDHMAKVLRMHEAVISTRGTKSAKKYVDPVSNYTSLSLDQVMDEMLAVFARQCPVSRGELSDAERAAMQQLVVTRFATDKWQFKVP